MIFVTLWAQFTAPTISRGPNFRTNIFRGPTCRKKSQWVRFANVEEEDDDVDDEDKGRSVEQKVWLIDDECPSHLHVLISISKWNYVIKLHRRCFLAVGTVSPQIQQIGCNLKKIKFIPHICHGQRPCKFFLAGVNFYRFNAKNWHKLGFLGQISV